MPFGRSSQENAFARRWGALYIVEIGDTPVG